MPPSPLARLRRLCLALPEGLEVYAAANNHHGAGRPAVWCKAALLDQRGKS